MKLLVILVSLASATAMAGLNTETPIAKPGKVLVCKNTVDKTEEVVMSDCKPAKGFTHSKSKPASLSERHSRN